MSEIKYGILLLMFPVAFYTAAYFVVSGLFGVKIG
jgi:hypothetical protein